MEPELSISTLAKLSFKHPKILCSIVFLFLLCIILPIAGSSNPDNDSFVLKLADPIIRDIMGGQQHIFVVKAKYGDIVHVKITQRDADIMASLINPSGDTVMESDTTRFASEEEDLYAIVETGGSYQVVIRPRREEAPPDQYEVTLVSCHQAGNEEAREVAARVALIKATTLQRANRAGALDEAEQLFQKAVELWEDGGESPALGDCFFGLGSVATSRGQNKKALDYFEQALDQYGATEEEKKQNAVLIEMGVTLEKMGCFQSANERYELVLSNARTTGDHQAEAAARYSIGSILLKTKEAGKSFDQFQQAMEHAVIAGDRQLEAAAVNALATLRWYAGRVGEAQEHFERALSISQEIDDLRTEANVVTNLGALRSGVGDPEGAMLFYDKALSLWKRVGIIQGLNEVVRKRGAALSQLGKYEAALDAYDEALARARATEDKRGEGLVLSARGRTLTAMGSSEQAIGVLNEALTIWRREKDQRSEAEALGGLGFALFQHGDYEQAEETLQQALSLARKLTDWDLEATCLYRIALIKEDRGDLHEARIYAEESLNIVESLRTWMSSERLRSKLLVARHSVYDLLIRVLQALHSSESASGYQVRALEVSERKRARALLDTLARAGRVYTADADPELISKAEALQLELSLASLRTARSDEEELANQRMLEEFDAVQKQLSASPLYATLTQGRPRKVSEIQKYLDDETLWIEYALGEPSSFVWAVQGEAVVSRELPAKEVLEQKAQQLLTLLRQSNRRGALRETELAAAELGEILLGPIDELGKYKRLMIIPDGVLHTIPFAALRVAIEPGEESKPLVTDKEISTLASASLFALLRETHSPAPTERLITIFADPVFSREDERVAPRALQKDPSRQRSTAKEFLSFTRLPFTRIEAEKIIGHALKYEVFSAFDFAAAKETLLAGEVRRSRLLHLATHAAADLEHPELSGVVLSLVDKKGEPRDGFLYFSDICALKIRADLVTLSACDTASGRYVQGEGVIGLTQGFLYAGAPLVLASLWKVDDEATMTLMDIFYGCLLEDGMSPLAALRKAQLKVAEEWPAPYYWAAFVIQGDWMAPMK